MEQEKKSGLAVDVFSGLGLGLLLGVIMGMAQTPVVATVVGALTSVLAIFLGLEGGGDSKLASFAKVQLNGVRIGSFATATVLGLLLGLYIRINNPLVDSPTVQLSRWHEAFPVEVAPSKPLPGVRYAADADEAERNRTLSRQLMIFERTGLTPATLTYGPGAAPQPSKDGDGAATESDATGSGSQAGGGTAVSLSGTAATRLAILFGKGTKSNPCRDLSPEAFTPSNGKLNVEGWETAFLMEEGFARAAATIDAADAGDKERLLRLSHDLLCDLNEFSQGGE